MNKTHRAPTKEFIALMAVLTSVIPLAIDSMLPAFPQIGTEFNITAAADLQLIIATLFLGFGFGQLIFGPLSDVFGRKPPIYVGVIIFICGSVLSGISSSYTIFLVGRFLQGFGGAAPRIISLALIRDQFAGDSMAKVTSLIMTIFILVPAVAPTLGQGIMYFAGWREIFMLLFAMGLLVLIWFAKRQKETLPPRNRKTLRLPTLWLGLRETFTQPTTVVCMIVSGMVFGIFVGYLGAVQAIFFDLFHVKEQFPLYFAMLALSIGMASVFNARLVMALGMRKLILLAFTSMAFLSNLFVIYLYLNQIDNPPLWLFMIYMSLTFFSVGFLFGNLNALAMQPLGHVAGIGSALLGFTQSSLSVVIGVFLGRFFHDSIIPLALSFGAISLLGLALFIFEMKITKNRLSL